MYADDTTLHGTYDTIKITDKPTHTIYKELSLIVTWYTENKLLINKSKTKITVFHMPQKHVVSPKLL